MAITGEEVEHASGSFEVATWRIVTLFLVIVAVDTVWELFDEFVTHRLQTRMHMGLLRAWEQLKFETMALGLISLLLVVGEEKLLKVCINSPDGEKEAYEDSEHKQATVPTSAEAPEQDHHRRRLMASGGGHSCPGNQEPIWESELIHKAHLLIFLIAVCYIAYAVVSIALSMLAMRRWHKFEQRVSGGELLPLPLGGLQHHGEPSFVFGLRQCLRQFTHPLDIATYSALRALFVGRVQVGADFNFAAMIQEYLTEEFAKVVRFDLIMWAIAILWMVFPDGSYGGFFMKGLFIVLSVAAGAKLTVVTMHLARHAYREHYSAPAANPPSPRYVVSDAARDPSDASVFSAMHSSGGGADANRACANVAAVTLGHDPRSRPVAEGRNPPQEAAGIASLGSAPSDEPEPKRSRAVRRAIRGHSQLIKARKDSDSDRDLLRLFWFSRPRLVLHVFRYAFFQNSIAFAALIFGFWQKESIIFGAAVQGFSGTVRAIAYLLLFCVILLLVHTSMFLFPMYALCAGTAEFGSPSGILDFARRRGIRPDLVRFLEETAPPAKSSASSPTKHPNLECGHAASIVNPRRPAPDPRTNSEQHNNEDGSYEGDDYEDYGPPVVASAGCGPDEGPEAVFQSGHMHLASAPRPDGPGRGGGSGGSGGTTPSHYDMGPRRSEVQPVPLTHAYSNVYPPPMVEAAGAGFVLATTYSGGDDAAAGSGGGRAHADSRQRARHSMPQSHLAGMTNTVQGLLEEMASTRVQGIASRVRRPRR